MYNNNNNRANGERDNKSLDECTENIVPTYRLELINSFKKEK